MALEDGTERLSREFDNELPQQAAKWRRSVLISDDGYLGAPARSRLDYSHDQAVGEVIAAERRNGLPGEVTSPPEEQVNVDQVLS